MRYVYIVIAAILVLAMLSGCAAGPNNMEKTPDSEDSVAGFWLGLWQGFIVLFTFIFSVFVHAPLLQLANTNLTPNPSKAPWYFLGLQEMLTMFHPMVAGVTLPGVGLIALVLAPYLDRNPSNKPEDRKFLYGLFSIFLMFWAVLVLIGSFFRGPGFNFVLPWVEGLFFEL